MAKGLSRQRLIDTALEMVDREGLESLSMRRLGAALGVDPMAAYRHLPNKEALLDGVMEAVLAGVDLSVDESAPWHEQLRVIMRSYHQALLDHPNAIPLVAQRLFTTAGTLRLVQKGLEIATGAGVPVHVASLMITSSGFLSHGVALFTAAQARDTRTEAEQAAALSRLPREEFEEFLSAVESGAFASDFQEMLEFGLDALIDRLRLAIEH